MFTYRLREVDALTDDADNAAVAAASGCKELRATICGGCSAVEVSYSGGISRLFILPLFHL